MSAEKPSQPASLEEQNERLRGENETLRKRLDKAQADIERLRKELEEALRSLKRQAAPFSKRKPKENPKQPGRKPGSRYGARGARPIPERVNEEISVPLPTQCPCGGTTVYQATRPQYQEDIIRQTVVRRFDVAVGYCTVCGRRVQGRHPLQTSDALGAAQVQIGPEALSLSVHLNKEMGISHERVARALSLGFGLEVSRSGLCRALLRMGEKATPTYEGLKLSVRQSAVNWLDETGWRVAARLEWLWVFMSQEVTVYAILPGRGFAQAALILGEDYSGALHHDGWRPYYRFTQAYHQSCLSHLLRRCEALVQSASPSAARFPQAVMELLLRGLTLRDRYALKELSEHGLKVATGRLEAALDQLLSKRYQTQANRRLARHLRHERPWLFTFLHCDDIDATNNAAERALRPAVIARKTWGGNRSPNGAKAQQILSSILRTCQQQGKETFARIRSLLFTPVPTILDIVPQGPAP
jgi:transposase